jgi:hypothetical protein
MRVSELMEVLSKLPPDQEVVFRGDGPDFADSQGRMQIHYHEITDIYQVRSLDGGQICELSDATNGYHSPYYVDGEEYRTLLLRDWDIG